MPGPNNEENITHLIKFRSCCYGAAILILPCAGRPLLLPSAYTGTTLCSVMSWWMQNLS
jgi:hypothetical protein